MIAECALVRRVVAERTVGGIKKDSVLPAGLTFTLFVEWLLRGDAEPVQDEDPKGVIALNTDTATQVLPVEQYGEHEAELRFTITEPGTAEPHTVCFYSRPIGTSGAVAPRDTLVYTTPYVDGQTVYYAPIEKLPLVQTEYYATMDFKRKYEQTEDEIETDPVPYVPPAKEDVVFFAAVEVGTRPTESAIVEMDNIPMSAALLNTDTGVHFTVSPNAQAVFVAFPTRYQGVSWFATDAAYSGRLGPEAAPDIQYSVLIDGERYTAYVTERKFYNPHHLILTTKV